MFRFSIRELLVLTLAAGLALGWWLDHRANAASAEDARFLANVAVHGCHCQLVDQYMALQEKYGVKPVFDASKWEELTASARKSKASVNPTSLSSAPATSQP